jgi:hypothetical protein
MRLLGVDFDVRKNSEEAARRRRPKRSLWQIGTLALQETCVMRATKSMKTQEAAGSRDFANLLLPVARGKIRSMYEGNESSGV